MDGQTTDTSSPRRLLWIVLAILVGMVLWQLWHHKPWSLLSQPQAEPRVVTARGDLAENEQSTIELFDNASASVVHITTVAVRRDMFSLNIFEIPQGTGSGFVWDKEGHVVTNFHVLRNAQRARVTLADQSTWDAQLVGAEPDKELAVLRISAPADKLQPVPIGQSVNLQVGQSVFAIGNPFGLDQTLTSGIISGLGREIKSVTGRPIRDVIQTDAAINPGNSGGPLLDSAGRLIGVNTAIVSPSGAYAGIGFAVPADTVNRIVPQLILHGRIQRPGLGISIAPDSVLRRLRMKGILVLDVMPGGAGQKCGLRPTRRDSRGRVVLGDIITAVDDKQVEDNSGLFTILDQHEIGQTVTVTIRREDQQVKLEAVLQAID